MSKLLGKELTPALVERLDGRNAAAHDGKIIPIFTIDDSGWPHPALLSYYEVIARDPGTLDLALWKNSSTARHLARSGKITLMVIDRGVNFYLKGAVAAVEEEMPGLPQVSRFRITLDQVIEDQEPNAEITGGMTYHRARGRAESDFAVKVLQHLRSQ